MILWRKYENGEINRSDNAENIQITFINCILAAC